MCFFSNVVVLVLLHYIICTITYYFRYFFRISPFFTMVALQTTFPYTAHQVLISLFFSSEFFLIYIFLKKFEIGVIANSSYTQIQSSFALSLKFRCKLNQRVMYFIKRKVDLEIASGDWIFAQISLHQIKCTDLLYIPIVMLREKKTKKPMNKRTGIRLLLHIVNREIDRKRNASPLGTHRIVE